ncbi:PAS domain S-box protein [Thiorhodovibrio winogradskyi]|uniref:PAS domain S-box protein n=2 Tax=Thiorhodovibrio TaxID=61593 RepID=UPI001911BD03|nr:PAS domain S-box protein [Thiorhodovibrio winogradskyi]
MISDFSTKSPPKRVAFVAGLLCCLTLSVFAVFLENSLWNGKIKTARQVSESIARQVNHHLAQNLSATYALAALVREGKGTIRDFETIATELIHVNPGVAALQLAPGGVVRQCVPLSGNEGAIGLNLLTDEPRNREARLALETGKLTLAGPFHLIQGGTAVIGRLPVFLDEPQPQTFWGFTIALIDLAEFLEIAHLGDLEAEGYRWELWHPDADDRQRNVFATSQEPLTATPVTSVIDVPNGRWMLGIAPANGWFSVARLIAETAGILALSILLGWILRRHLEQQRQIDNNAGLFQAVMDASPIPFAITERDAIRHLNPAFVSLLGYTLSDIPTQEDWFPRAYPNPAYREQVAREWQRRLEQAEHAGKPFEPMEVRVHGRDGSVRTMLASAQPLGAAFAERMLISMADITQVRASAERLRILLDSASDGVHILDADGNVVDCSQSFARMLGYSLDEARRLNVADWDVQIPHEQLPAELRRLIREPSTFETLHRRKDGSTFAVEINSTRVVLDGQSYLYASSRDVSERRFYETALRDSEARFRSIFERANAGIVFGDPMGNLIVCNASFRALMGYSEDELKGMNFAEFTDPEDLKREQVFFDDILAGTCSDYRMEKRYRVSDGGMVWVDLAVTALRDDQGEVTNVVGLVVDITERKLAAANLEASERRYRALIEASAQIVWSCDPDGVATGDSPSWQAYTGQTFAQWSGYGYAEAIHPEDRPAVMERWRDALAKGETCTNEYRLQHVSGEWRWNLARGVPIKDDTGTVLSWVGINSDIHDRRMVEEELRVSQQRYDLAVRGSNDGLWDWNIQTNTLYLAPRFMELMGYQDNEFEATADWWWPRIHPEDKDAVWAAVEAHLRNEAPFEEEYRLRHKSSEYFWVKARGAAIFDAEGQPLRMAGSIRDITQQKEAERRLQEAMNRLRLATRVAAIGVWVWDLADNTLTWDQRMYEIYQVPEDLQATGLSYDDWRSRCHPADLGRAEEELEAAMRGERPFDSQFRILLPDGSMRHIHSAAIVEKDDFGKPLRFVGFNRDLTDQKAAETALLAAKQEAETAASQAAAANRAKSEFLANMSHEIRTPMNAVMGLAQLLLDTELSTRQRDYLTKLYKAAHSLLGILNDILDYSKIEAGKLDLEVVDVEMAELLESAANLFSLAVEDKGLELIVEIDPDIPPMLLGDPLRLRQIMNNLLGNAVKFTQKGHITLSMRLVERQGDEVTLKVSVQDTGIGMTSEQVGRLFRAFEQADASTTRRFGGTGLGLTITKHLVDMMSGEISVESQPGQGSTFSFQLRLQVSPTAIPTPKQAKKDAAAHPPGTRNLIADDQKSARDVRNMRSRTHRIRGAEILLVEDNPTNQLVACDLLEKMGLRVTLANHGREAVEQAAARRFDAILMDLQMPEMDGLEATRRIRALPQGPDVPIIAMTAAAMTADREASQSAGMNDFLAKPIDIAELTTALLRWISPLRGEEASVLMIAPIAPTASPDGMGIPFEIAGLDLDDARRHMGGDWNLLRRALDGFARDFAESAADLDDHLAQGRWAEARRLVHTLTGIAKTIGATALHEASQPLEVALAAEKSRSTTAFKTALADTLSAIATLPPLARVAPVSYDQVPDDQASYDQAPYDQERTTTLLQELQMHLKRSEFVRPEWLDEIEQGLVAPPAQSAFRKLKTKIEAFDYPAANQSLATLASLLDIALDG